MGQNDTGTLVVTTCELEVENPESGWAWQDGYPICMEESRLVIPSNTLGILRGNIRLPYLGERLKVEIKFLSRSFWLYLSENDIAELDTERSISAGTE